MGDIPGSKLGGGGIAVFLVGFLRVLKRLREFQDPIIHHRLKIYMYVLLTISVCLVYCGYLVYNRAYGEEERRVGVFAGQADEE